MLFKQGTQLYAFEIRREAGQDIMYINYLGAPYVPSLADSGEVMARTVDSLIQSQNISRIVFVQQRNYDYGFEQVALLLEISQLYNFLIKQERILSSDKLALTCQQCLPRRYEEMIFFVTLLKQDPVEAYRQVRRMLFEARARLDKSPDACKACEISYTRLIEKIIVLMESARLIKQALPHLDDYKGRQIYSLFFTPNIVPNFTFTRLVAELPEGELVEQYEISGKFEKSVVTILRKPDDAKYTYHIMPPEYSLGEDYQMLLNLARNVMIEHRPKAEEFTDVERTRQVFFNVARDLLQDLAKNKNIRLKYEELNMLASILVRHTIGFGLVEVLLQDKNLQDIVLNAPIALNPVFVRHAKYDECVTNIIPSQEDADSWAAKFRMLSGRPLDEANPILDTDLLLDKTRARVAVIQEPLSPAGLAYALRRHRDEPWTLPLFIKNKMINPLAAGLMSFLVDGARTMLIAGTRSSGKTSLLGALMLEIMPKFRIICIEDTLELPVDSLRKIGYDILRMKVRSALLKTTAEIAADEGIRTSLRFGDSCLIIGEVRSLEASALYEAMRVGALANVVAGTIHGASPYGVFDRVVNDLKVPATSFKATDVIVVANPIKSADGLHSWRRVVQLAEVRKHWQKDPVEEQGFVNLLSYNVDKDELEASDSLINGESEIIKDVASNVKGWVGDWDAVWDNIVLRTKIKEELVKSAEDSNLPLLLEAKFNSLSNAAFYFISDAVRQDIGVPSSDRVFPLWKDWLRKEVKQVKVGNSIVNL